AGTAVTPPPSVIVKDASGNPVSGVAVTFAVAPGNGTVTASALVWRVKDRSVAATSWTLSPTAGTNTLTATASGLTGSPVTFTATGTAGAATRLVLTKIGRATGRGSAAVRPQGGGRGAERESTVAVQGGW